MRRKKKKGQNGRRNEKTAFQSKLKNKLVCLDYTKQFYSLLTEWYLVMGYTKQNVSCKKKHSYLICLKNLGVTKHITHSPYMDSFQWFASKALKLKC